MSTLTLFNTHNRFSILGRERHTCEEKQHTHGYSVTEATEASYYILAVYAVMITFLTRFIFSFF